MLTEFTHRGSAKAAALAAIAVPATNRKISTWWEARFGPAERENNPLHSLHVELGARMTAFAGYEMPL